MNTKTLAKLFAFSAAAMCLGAASSLADEEHCRHVGGGVLTNFLPQTNPPTDCAASPINLCTDGTSTGDIRGGVGVTILGISAASVAGLTVCPERAGWPEQTLQYKSTYCWGWLLPAS